MLTRHRTFRLAVAGAVGAMALAGCSSTAETEAGGSTTQADGAFAVQTDSCLDPEAANAKIGDTIKIGWSLPLSGAVAATQVRLNRAYEARIKLYNEQERSIGGRQIDLQIKDDAYDPQRARQNVTELIEKDNVDVLGIAGAGQLAAVADVQNEACVPLLNSQVADPRFRDAQQYPWTTEYLPSAQHEMSLIADLVKAKVPDAKVGFIKAQTETGESYSKAMSDALAGVGIDVVTQVPLTSPAEAASSIKASGANVLFNASIGADCLSVPVAVAKAGFKPELLVQPSACSDPKSIYAAGGDALDGAVVMSWLKQPGSEGLDQDSGFQQYKTAVEGIGGDPTDTYTVMGWALMDIVIDALEKADASEAGLTRASIMNVARVQQYDPPLFMDGITWSMDPKDSLGIASLQPLQWNAAEARFEKLGDVLGGSGK